MLDQGVVGVGGAAKELSRSALEVGLVVGVECELPGGAGGVGADEAVAGPVVVGHDASQDLGVGVVFVTALAELDGVELVADETLPARKSNWRARLGRRGVLVIGCSC